MAAGADGIILVGTTTGCCGGTPASRRFLKASCANGMPRTISWDILAQLEQLAHSGGITAMWPREPRGRRNERLKTSAEAPRHD